MAILIFSLVLAVIVLVTALIIKIKDYNEILYKYSDLGKKNCDLKNENLTLIAQNARLTSENREYFVERMSRNLYDEFHKFVIVSDELSNYMEQMPKRLEEEGYKYDKEHSFPTVLCFTKRVPIKLKEKEEPNASDEKPN